jgi:hypothetical protein
MKMKLGSQTGSVMNHLYSRMTVGEPELFVGMGVTFLSWTDRSPGTIVEVNMKKRYIVATDDTYKRTDDNGMSESQDYEYTTNPDGYKRYFRKDKNGQWRGMRFNENGRLVYSGVGGLRVGERKKYHDFSF